MKTAISIPDELFVAADAAAKRLGMSRSRLYAEAVKTYLEKNGSRGVTGMLDQVYSETDSSLDPAFVLMQSASEPKGDW